MRKNVRIVAGAATALLLATFVTSCDDDDSTGPGSRTYTASLIGASEVPPVTTSGTGLATFVDNTTQIDYTLAVTGLTAVSASHIHVGPVGVNGGVIINLFIPNTPTGSVNGVIATGIITAANNSTVSLDSLRTLFNNGNAYVNVHTSANPGGAIRGQVSRSN